MRDGWTFERGTMLLLVGLAERVRRKRNEIRRLKRRNRWGRHEGQIATEKAVENELWNAYQDAKKRAIDYAMKRDEAAR